MHPAKAIRPVSTISIVFVRGLLSALLQRGPDPGEWLLRAGISPGFLKEDAARVTSAQYTALFRVLVEALDDEGIGFFSRPLRRGSLALVIRSTLGARTAGAALKRILNGLQLLQEDVRFAFVTRGERVGVQMEIPPAYLPERIFIHEMLLRILLSITAWLHGAHLKKLVFDLATPRPRYAAEFTRLFPGEVHFDQARTALWFDAAVLNQSMRHDETSLRLFLERTPEAIIVPERRQLGASGRVRKCLPAGRNGVRWKKWPMHCTWRSAPCSATWPVKAPVFRRSRTSCGGMSPSHGSTAQPRRWPRWHWNWGSPTARRSNAPSRPGPAVPRARTGYTPVVSR